MDGPLEQDKGALAMGSHNEYVLAKDEASVWIEVDGISVYVRRGSHGVNVALYRVDGEDRKAIAETYAPHPKVKRGAK